MNRNFIYIFSLFLFVASFSVQAEIRGRVDVGPTLLSVDLLESGKTEETLRMYGLKADATVLVYQGIAIKPTLLFGWGDGRISSASIAAGYYLPITEKFKVLPNVGYNWSYLSGKTELDVFGFEFKHLRERFRSESSFIGVDLSYAVTPKWTIIGSYQFAWCKTDTKINHFPYEAPIQTIHDRSHSSGSNYTLGVEYAYNDQWAINLGAGYNLSLTKEKHGVRGKGLKLGVAYYF